MDRYKDVLDAWSEQEMDSALILAEYLKEKYSPQSVIDLGCGSGLFLIGFEKDEIETLGIDGEAEGTKFTKNFKQADLRSLDTKELINKKYDIGISLEVAEHLHEEYADNFVDILASASDILIFSAAKPGQVGTNHYNCQPKEYWLEKFGKHNMFKDEAESSALVDFMNSQEAFLKTPWYPDNVMVIKRSESITS